MFIDCTVKSAKANDLVSRRLAEQSRRSIYGEAIRVPRELRDARIQHIEMANRGWDWDDYLGVHVPPNTNRMIIRRQAI
jgi:hypothetical protein